MSPRERAAAQEEEAAAYIPADIYEEILYRLSCTQVSKLRFVCKDWLRLISCPKFIRKHQERSKGSASGTRILTLSGFEKIRQYRYAEGDINVIGKGESSPIPNPNNHNLCILGSCDGLVLFKVGHDNKIALMNPCTGTTETHDLPGMLGDSYTQIDYNGSWFGQHPSTREYVLVLVTVQYVNGTNLVFKVCSLSGNTVSTVSIKVLHNWIFFFQCIGTFLHGRIHFPVCFYPINDDFYSIYNDEGLRYAILGFDFESNKIFKTRAPPMQSRDFTLEVVEGCLSAIIVRGPDVIEMWIMKEERWSKYANINVRYRVLEINPIAYFPNGDVIIETEGDQYHIGKRGKTSQISVLYNLKDMEIKQYFEAFYNTMSTVDKSGGIACVESLVTPAMVWRGRGRNQDYIHTHQLDFYNID